jgi:glycerophosphoryl diester phosphodiesterase
MLQPISTMTTLQTARPRIVGHRGSLYQYLENTLDGFLACAGTCDAIELDVFELPKDKSLVVFHGSGSDKNPGLLENYCLSAPDGATSILDLDLEQAQQLLFNPDYDELAAPASRVMAGKVPTLEQVLTELKPTGMEVKIELKGPGTARPVVELVDRLGMVNQVSFSSFNHNEIETVRMMRPQTNPEDGSYVYRTGALFGEVPDDFIERAREVGASEVHLRYDTCTSDRVQAIHEAGMGSMAWFRGPTGMKRDTTENYWDIGNEDVSCYQTVLDTGVQQMCINKPDVLAKCLHSQEASRQELYAMAVETVLPSSQMGRPMIAAKS